MNTQEEERIDLLNALLDYAEAEIEAEEREIIDDLECDWNDEEDIAECVVLVKRQRGDPRILPDGTRDWVTYEDFIDEGKVVITYVAHPEGTEIIFKLYPA